MIKRNSPSSPIIEKKYTDNWLNNQYLLMVNRILPCPFCNCWMEKDVKGPSSQYYDARYSCKGLKCYARIYLDLVYENASITLYSMEYFDFIFNQKQTSFTAENEHLIQDLDLSSDESIIRFHSLIELKEFYS